MDDLQEYLQEFMRLEGRGDYTGSACPGCSQDFTADPSDAAAEFVSAGYRWYRCDDCDDCALYCKGCTKARHTQHPLHRVKVRNFTDDRARIVLTSFSEMGRRPL